MGVDLLNMRYIAGVDGTKKGWAVALASADDIDAETDFCVLESFREILEMKESQLIIGVDMPIGLSAGPSRYCDRKARDFLGWPRRTSVFSAPIRPALSSSSYKEAHSLTKSHSENGRGISRQSWAIFPKVREVDDLMSPALQKRVIEVHPEVVFAAIGDGPLKQSKKKKEGFESRLRLIKDKFPDVEKHVNKHWGIRDDVLDAYAALFTALSHLEGKTRTLPAEPPVDEMGLRMEIVYPVVSD